MLVEFGSVIASRNHPSGNDLIAMGCAYANMSCDCSKYRYYPTEKGRKLLQEIDIKARR